MRTTVLAVAVLSGWLETALAQEDEGREHSIPLFVEHLGEVDEQQGFVRIINHSNHAGTVRIYGIDDNGTRYGPTDLPFEALETKQFNSEDFELGHERRLPEGVGSGEGNWRLLLYADDLDIEPLAYVRTTHDDFLTSMHDVAQVVSRGHRVPTFNPASNEDSVSRLRLINPGDTDANVTITGRDDAGAAGESEVRLAVPAGGAVAVTSLELEDGGAGIEGSLGNKKGKWALDVVSDVPIQVMSLVNTGSGHLSNLSATKRDYPGAVGLWQVSFEDDETAEGFILLMPDSRMYAWLPEMDDTVSIARATFRIDPGHVSGSGEMYESGKIEQQGFNVSGGSDDFDFSAEYRSGDWIRGSYTVDGEASRAFRGWATTGFDRGSSNQEILGLWSPELGDDADLPGEFELDAEGAFDITFTAGGIDCDADGTLLPVNAAFNFYEAEPYIQCSVIVFDYGRVELVHAVMDSKTNPGGGDRAVILVVVPDQRKIALGATFLLERS